MDRIESVAIFVEVAERRSFAAAARRLARSAAAVLDIGRAAGGHGREKCGIELGNEAASSGVTRSGKPAAMRYNRNMDRFISCCNITL